MDKVTKDTIRAGCRADLMQVEVALVKTYTAVLRGQGQYAAIDGGAHTGYHTERFAALDGCRQVIAVEADPWTVRRLRARMDRLDEMLRGKVQIEQLALQENQERDTVSWMSSVSHPGRSGISSIWQNDSSVQFRQQVTVPATTIDILSATATERVAMIKLDLEGGDFMAIKGGGAIMRKDRPFIVFENSNRAPGIYGFSTADMRRFFAEAGYQPITFFGEIAEEANWFDFWEMWAVPDEECARFQPALGSVLSDLMSEFQAAS